MSRVGATLPGVPSGPRASAIVTRAALEGIFCPCQFSSLGVKRQELLWKGTLGVGGLGEVDPQETQDRVGFAREVNGECPNGSCQH